MIGTSWQPVTNPLQSSGKRPRGWAQIGGQYCSVLKFQVAMKRPRSANTFSIHLEPFQQPEGFDFQYWADKAPGGVQVEVFAGFLSTSQDVTARPSDPTSLILGMADDVAINPLTGHLEVTGRDMTSKLIDQKTSNRWPQHTSSQIVTTLAQQAGLQVQATNTSTPAGEYYSSAYGQLARSRTMWDLITYLAKNEGYDAYVKGNTLYFQPPQSSATASPIQITIGRNQNGVIVSNATTLEFHRRLTLAQNLQVHVKSHHGWHAKSVDAVATRGAKGGGSGTQAYSVSRPNKSEQQAQQLANNMLGKLAQHEFGFSATMDADLTRTALDQAQIIGTGTSFDTTYDLASLTFDWDSADNGGLKMAFSAKLEAPKGQGGTNDPLAPVDVPGDNTDPLSVPDQGGGVGSTSVS